MKKKSLRFFFPLLAVGLVAIFGCAYGLIHEIYIYSQGRAYYEEQIGIVEYRETADEQKEDVDNESHIEADSGQSVLQSAPPLQIDFAALRKSAPDAVGWIRCPGTAINYPIVHGMDNVYYLNHLPDGTGNKVGSIFLDYNNSGDFSDYNSAIYGHHIRSGDMFAILGSYRNQQFYDDHPVIELYTPDCTYLLELFAGYMADAGSETIPLSFEDSYRFMQYIEEIRLRSFFESSVIVGAEDRIVSLCTCTYNYSDERIVIVAKMMGTARTD